MKLPDCFRGSGSEFCCADYNLFSGSFRRKVSGVVALQRQKGYGRLYPVLLAVLFTWSMISMTGERVSLFFVLKENGDSMICLGQCENEKLKK